MLTEPIPPPFINALPDKHLNNKCNMKQRLPWKCFTASATWSPCAGTSVHPFLFLQMPLFANCHCKKAWAKKAWKHESMGAKTEHETKPWFICLKHHSLFSTRTSTPCSTYLMPMLQDCICHWWTDTNDTIDTNDTNDCNFSWAQLAHKLKKSMLSARATNVMTMMHQPLLDLEYKHFNLDNFENAFLSINHVFWKCCFKAWVLSHDMWSQVANCPAQPVIRLCLVPPAEQHVEPWYLFRKHTNKKAETLRPVDQTVSKEKISDLQVQHPDQTH